MSKPIVLCFLSLVLCLTMPLPGQEFSFARPRPLMALTAELRQTYGVPVTYEDAPYDPVSELSGEIIPRNGIISLTPKWNPVVFHVSSILPTLAERAASKESSDVISLGEALIAVQDLVDQYNRSGNPGQFAATQDGRYLHIQQIKRKVSGQTQSFKPISGTLLAWQSKPENCYQVLNDLSDALAQTLGYRVAQGNLPSNLMLYGCNVAGESLTVRQVLESVIDAMNKDLATGRSMPPSPPHCGWDLVYDPNGNKYFLSLTPVQSTSNLKTGPSRTTTTSPGAKQGQSRLGSAASQKP